MPSDTTPTLLQPSPRAVEAALDRVRDLLAASVDIRTRNRQLRESLREHMRELHGHFDQLTAHHQRLSGGTTDDVLKARYGLTERELDVARLLAEGRRNTDIAAVLRISPHTARHHTQHVLAKLGVHSRAEAGARLRA